MTNGKRSSDTKDSELGLADAIALLREELNKARNSEREDDLQLPITSITVELSLTAGWLAGGKAGFKVPFIDIGAEGSRKRDTGHKVVITFEAPTDKDGRPIRVRDESNDRKG
ncbi:trypco2 family protein [Arthrobacter gyeryongensis]|uniref:trypco2 family protein n=1 Tax=Arthrobacter gyeryongensis TaxID=1650592 RepID=UPI0031E658F8